jgi:hypothetical protein
MPSFSSRTGLTDSQLADACMYNANKAGTLWVHARLPEPLRRLPVDSSAFAWVVLADQHSANLGQDGQLGPSTLSLYPEARPDVVDPGVKNPIFDDNLLRAMVDRARTALGLGITYRLGKGGFDPTRPRPDQASKCDCSGFIAWAIGVSRDPSHATNPMGSWIETTRMVVDATGAQKLFVAIPSPVPGCIVAYPDVDGKEGHTGIVTESSPLRGIDCSSSENGIVERSLEFFNRRSDRVFMVRRDWVVG